MTQNFKKNFMFASAISALVFGLIAAVTEAISCKFYAVVCYADWTAFTLKSALILILLVLVFGLIMTSLFLIYCWLNRNNIQWKLSILLSAAGPVFIYYGYCLIAPGLTFTPTSLITSTQFFIAGAFSGVVQLALMSKRNKSALGR